VLATLVKLGFVTREFLLTPLQFGVPNSRLRYYLLAARPSGAFLSSVASDRILRHIPGYDTEWSDARSSSSAGSEMTENKVRSLREYLDRKESKDAYAVPEHVLMKWGRLFDIVLPSATRTCCFTRGQLFCFVHFSICLTSRRIYTASGAGGVHSPRERGT
jgi:tRNA (cytosine38-C5)-methyltransferase